LNSDPQKTVPALISHEHKEYLKELDQRLVVPTLLRFALNRSDAAVFSIELIAELGAVEALKNLRSIRQQEGKIPDWKAMVAHARTTKTQDGPAKELERLVTLKRRVQALEDAIAKLENKSTSKD
jgi:CHAD domain-containing protein